MSDITEKLRLKGLAEEEIYFAKADKELIRALKKRRLAKLAKCDGGREKKQAAAFEKRFEKVTDQHKSKPHKLAQLYRELLDDIKDACKRRK